MSTTKRLQAVRDEYKEFFFSATNKIQELERINDVRIKSLEEEVARLREGIEDALNVSTRKGIDNAVRGVCKILRGLLNNDLLPVTSEDADKTR